MADSQWKSGEIASLEERLREAIPSDELNGIMGMVRDAAKAADQRPPPVYSTHLPPAAYVRAHYIAGKEYNTLKETTGKCKVIRQSIRPSMEHGPTPDPESLSPITLQEVAKKVNYIHNDRILYLKTTYDAGVVVGASVLTEDDNGDNILLSLYNFLAEGEDPNERLGPGTYLALLAPYMKNQRDNREHDLMLRCDNPQCVILYDTKEEWLAAKTGKPVKVRSREPSRLRALGNAAFRDKLLSKASRLYSMALKSPSISQEDKIACLANRAEVSLRQGFWERVIEDSTTVLELDPSHIKATFRLAKAKLRLGLASDALCLALTLSSTATCIKDIDDTIADCERVVHEQSTGKFDLVEMRKDASSTNGMTNPAKLKFYGDFAATSVVDFGVEIKSAVSTSSTYRGCLAKKKLPQDFLICASKALVCIPRTPHKDSFMLQYSTTGRRIEAESAIQVVSCIVQMIHTRPDVGKRFYSLSAGNRTKASSDNFNPAKVDLALIRDIVSTNAFGIDGRTWNEELWWIWETERKKREGPLKSFDSDTPEQDMENHHRFTRGNGIWLRESLFNHSCTPNCTWAIVGDHMFIRTTRPVEEGEELCISYVAQNQSFDERTKLFERWTGPGNGFECRCQWCCAIRADDRLKDIESEVAGAHRKAEELFASGRMGMREAAGRALSKTKRRKYLEYLEATYPKEIQHLTGHILNLWQGYSLSESPESKLAALTSFQKAADIGLARKGKGMESAMDSWRLVWAALMCNDQTRALQNLRDIWKGCQFESFMPKSDAQECFRFFTVRHALPWWWDPRVQSERYGKEFAVFSKILVHLATLVCEE